ncbi:hypothetical protein WG628_19835 [Stenotrophomonas maltophilia]
MSNSDDRHSCRSQRQENFPLLVQINVRCRLIQKKDPGAAVQGTSNQKPLPLAS